MGNIKIRLDIGKSGKIIGGHYEDDNGKSYTFNGIEHFLALREAVNNPIFFDAMTEKYIDNYNLEE